MAGLRHGEVFLRAEAQPRLLNHTRPGVAGDFYGIIAAAGIDHNQFRCKSGRIEAGGDFGAGIAGDHHDGQGKRGKRIGHRESSGRSFAPGTARQEGAANSTCKPIRNPPGGTHASPSALQDSLHPRVKADRCEAH